VPMLQSILGELNYAFGRQGMKQTVEHRESFAPGKPLDFSMIVGRDSKLHDSWVEYLERLPPSIKETLRSVVYQSLSTKPPTLITFAWMPGYDYELHLSQAPDTKTTRGGITILMRSRYPSDSHPLSRTAGKSKK